MLAATSNPTTRRATTRRPRSRGQPAIPTTTNRSQQVRGRSRRPAVRTRRGSNRSTVTVCGKIGPRPIPKKEERRQGRSQGPRNGAQQNSTWPTPLTGRAKHCFCWIQEPFGSGLRFLGKQNLKLALHQIVARPFIRPRLCPGHLLQVHGPFGDSAPCRPHRLSLQRRPPTCQTRLAGDFSSGHWPICKA